MKLYTIGFTQKSAKQFFELIRNNDIEILIDIRLNNQSQLAGFSKGRDLEFFLSEICDCKYAHEPVFAPTKELLNDYKHGNINWDEYEVIFKKIMDERKIECRFKEKYGMYSKVCLLCSEVEANKCHRRLIAERIRDTSDINIQIKHI